MNNDLRIYACGGAAINIAKKIAETKLGEGAVRGNTVYVDTSKSNMLSGFDKENVYVIDNVDGSGKKRAENAKAIESQMEKDNFLAKFPPGRFNIVLFSNSGGTGSVSGPFVVRDLNKVKAPTVVVCLSTLESVQSIENCSSTLLTLENIARRTGMPVPMIHTIQSTQAIRMSVDEQMRLAVMELSLIMSGLNHELDSQDIQNFLQYTNVPACKHLAPRLTLLHRFNNGDDNINKINAITTLDLLTRNPDDVPVENTTLYRAVGYTDAAVSKAFSVVQTFDGVLELVTLLNEEADKIKNLTSSAPGLDSILDASSDDEDGYMIF